MLLLWTTGASISSKVVEQSNTGVSPALKEDNHSTPRIKHGCRNSQTYPEREERSGIEYNFRFGDQPTGTAGELSADRMLLA